MSGVWIGVDFGTTHSGAAVWDSSRGRPKVMRLASALPEPSKHGRLVPTVLVLIVQSECHNLKFSSKGVKLYSVDTLKNIQAIIGSPALELFQQSYSEKGGDGYPSPEEVSMATISNLKSLFASGGRESISSDFSTTSSITVTPLGSKGPIQVDVEHLLEIFLSAMRLECQDYLQRNQLKKNLKVPCETTSLGDSKSILMVHHAVVGVPCTWNQATRRRLEATAAQAGFVTAHVLTEPTAACLSYGLGVVTAKTVLVFDMGGGTTDVTIAELEKFQQKVVVTHGAAVGGNDLDEAILRWVLESQLKPAQTLTSLEQRTLLRSCKDAKEKLCSSWSSMDVVEFSFRNQTLRLNKDAFTSTIEPFLQKAETVVQQALEKYEGHVDEVVLVGGSTRVPAVPDFLTRASGCKELCTVHSLTAVAQGTAIHAARISSCVPNYELQSSLLLDVLPYPIGVVSAAGDGKGEFVSVLQQYAAVPVRGSVRFALAHKEQTGVTVPIVELVDDNRLVEIRSFQFLLHRLQPHQLERIETRWIEIRLEFTEYGQLIAMVVDELDPDHQRRYLNLRTESKGSDADALPMGLVLTCIAVAVLYVAVKLAFHEAEVKG